MKFLHTLTERVYVFEHDCGALVALYEHDLREYQKTNGAHLPESVCHGARCKAKNRRVEWKNYIHLIPKDK